MNNIFSQIAAMTPGAAAAATPAEPNPQDISREELMKLCIKMQARMQQYEAKGKALFKKKTTIAAERQKLLDLLRMVMPVPTLTSDDDELNLDTIEQSWAEFEVRRRDQLAALEAKVVEKEQLMQQSLKSMEEHYKRIIADLKVNSPIPKEGNAEGANEAPQEDKNASIAAIIEAEQEKLAAQTATQELQRRVAKADLEVERLRQVEIYLKQQIGAMEGAITSKNAEIEQLQRDAEQAKASFEERVVALQLAATNSTKESTAQKGTVDKLQAQIASLQRQMEEKDLSYKSNKDLIQALQSRLIELEPELAQCKDKIAQMERNNSAQALMKAEQTALTQSLRADLKVALDEVEAHKRRNRDLEEQKVKAEGQLLKLAALTEQVQGLQSAIEDKDSLITRMRSEQQTSERNHAMRTAMLATCEAQLETLQAEMAEKDRTAAELIERVTSLQAALAASEARLAERVKESTAEIAALEAKVAEITHDREISLQSLDRIHTEALEALKRDHAKKAAMARTLLSEKEEEVRTLSARVTELQDEINSGTPQERKIFELATTQARRETLHGVHNDTREIAFAQLQSKLAAKDLELAKTQQALSALQSEVVELRRVHQREGINMDYLKNIVIQYMTFPAQSSEKMSLVPVLAMLLQFTPKEMSVVQRAVLLEPTSGGLWSSWGLGGAAPKSPSAMPVFASSRPAKEVKRPTAPIPLTPPPTTGAAGGSAGKGKSPSLSSGSMTTAALVQSAGAKGATASPAAVASAAAGTARAGGSAEKQSAMEQKPSAGGYEPPVPYAAGPLSPSNSDVEGGYSPPKLPQLAVVAPGSAAAASAGNGTAPSQGSLMVESHTDTGTSDDPAYATPMKKLGSPRTSRGSAGSFSRPAGTTPGSGVRAGGRSTNRMPINRANSMNASDYEFQQKLKSIGSDILSLDNSVSYDDAELDMVGDATYVDYEEGIEEGDEADDGQDGTSV